MASGVPQTRLTPDEYLAWERKAKRKNEYLCGHILAMSGASFTHNIITANTTTALNNQLVESGCIVVASDMRVWTSPEVSYFYPDVLVVCDEPRFEDDTFDTLLNPIVLVEVLSPSTEAYDSKEKFEHYKQLTSLREYLLVSQNQAHVKHYFRHGTQWILTEFRLLEDVLTLDSIKCQLFLREIYAHVNFAGAQA